MQSVKEILQFGKFKETLNAISKADYDTISSQRFLKFPLLIVNLIFFDTAITKRQIKILIFIMRFSFGCKQAVANLKLTDFQKMALIQEKNNERKRKHEQDIAVKKISLNETNLDIPELESCITDAKRFIEHLSTFWINLSHGQKRKMTEFLFPKGLIWDGKEY